MNHLAKEEHKRRLEKLYRATSTHYPGTYHNDKRGGIMEKGYPYSTNRKNIKSGLDVWRIANSDAARMIVKKCFPEISTRRTLICGGHYLEEG